MLTLLGLFILALGPQILRQQTADSLVPAIRPQFVDFFQVTPRQANMERVRIDGKLCNFHGNRAEFLNFR
jgi:hypothetical protein